MKKVLCAVAAVAAMFVLSGTASAHPAAGPTAAFNPVAARAYPHPYFNGYRYNPYYGRYYNPYRNVVRPPRIWIQQNVWVIPGARPMWHPSYGFWYWVNPYTGQVFYWWYYQY